MPQPESQRGISRDWKKARDDLVLLGEVATKGEIRPVIDRTYALDNIVEAHTFVGTGHKRGNVVVSVA